MTEPTTISVPDIGDFSDIPVIEILVSPGDRIEAETALVTLESDKATMDVPSPRAGTVAAVLVTVGDTVSEGTPIVTLAPIDASPSAEAPTTAAGVSAGAGAAPAPARAANLEADVVVLGAGPGGYTAAFRAADLGLRTVLVERYPTLGGVCLNVGCIPSKALLHTAAVIDGANESAAHGVTFGAPSIDLETLAGWKNTVVAQLTRGLVGLAGQRKVEIVRGVGAFASPHRLRVATTDGATEITFAHAIIAAGSQAIAIPEFPNDDPRLMDSTDALRLDAIPRRLLVIGGGIIGLEMATVYAALGARVSVVELMDELILGCDRDLVKPLERRIRRRYEAIWTATKVTAVVAEEAGLRVSFEGADAPTEDIFDRVLVAVGRRPNGDRIGAEHAGVHVDARGFIPVDLQQRTNVDHIFAIGDITGPPMLAHKATHQGKTAAEVCADRKSSFDATAIPSVAYTDPEIAWVGLTEAAARAQGIEVEQATFPWSASGRALGISRSEGLTKLMFERDGGRLLGAGIVGPHAGDLIAETTLAIEMGADAQDIGLTIHPHPTLAETICFAAEMVEGTITDLYAPRRPR